MRIFLLLPVLLILASCVGVPLRSQHQPPPFQQFLGASKDEILIAYGAPSRTSKLEDGTRILEYDARFRTLYKEGHREKESCTLRFWLTEKTVTHVDSLGDFGACDYFAGTRIRDGSLDLKNR